MASIEKNQTITGSESPSDVELMSSLLDGETAGVSEEDIQSLLDSSDSRSTWHRYNLIGDALRHGERVESVDQQASVMLGGSTSFADRVKDQITEEPTVLAPRKRTTPKYLQPVAGLALAASVAGLAVIGVQQMNQETDEAQPLSVANISLAEQVLSAPAAVENTDTPELEVDLAEHQRRLNSYLVNYNAQRASLGMPGVNPYVRIVGFESEK